MNTDIVALSADSWHSVRGRGRIACVDLRDVPGCPDPIRDRSQMPLRVGQLVLIDLGFYVIRDIECVKALVHPSYIKPDVGLVVIEADPGAVYDALQQAVDPGMHHERELTEFYDRLEN